MLALFDNTILVPLPSGTFSSLSPCSLVPTMPECRSILILWVTTALVVVSAFVPPRQIPLQRTLQLLPTICNNMVAGKVEVCGFKDCKRAGGGPRLVKEIGQILEEKGMATAIVVEPCECQVRLRQVCVCINYIWPSLKFIV